MKSRTYNRRPRVSVPKRCGWMLLIAMVLWAPSAFATSPDDIRAKWYARLDERLIAVHADATPRSLEIMHGYIDKAIDRLASDNPGGVPPAAEVEASKNFESLMDEAIARSTLMDGSVHLEEGTTSDLLKYICPLYPFC